MILSPAASQKEIVRGTAEGADCENCPLAKHGRPFRWVTSEGPRDPEFIIVGESPGGMEVNLGRPFVGPSGRMVNDVLSRTAASRDRVHVTNAFLCQPPPEAPDTLKRAAKMACRPRLMRELAQFPGRPILALGGVAAQAILNDERISITKVAGAYHEVDFDGTGPRAVIPSMHPAAILRGGAGGATSGAHTVDLLWWALLYDVGKVVRLAHGNQILFSDDIQVEPTNPRRAEALLLGLLREVEEVKVLAIDTETYVDDPARHSALQPINARLKAIGFATPARAVSVAWDILDFAGLRAVRWLLLRRGIRRIMHNRIYDEPVLNKYGFPIEEPIEDTLLLHHNAFPGLPHDLQRVTSMFFAVRPWKAEFRHGKGTLEELLPYNARDVLATARVRAPLNTIVDRVHARRTYDVDIAMARIAARMHVVGVPVDRARNEELRVQFSSAVDKARAQLLSLAQDPAIREDLLDRIAFEQARAIRKGDSLDFDLRKASRRARIDAKPFEFNVNAADHIVAFLRARGVPLTIQTPTGRISTKKEILEAFARYAEVRAIISLRENLKLLSTFVWRMFDRVTAEGRPVYGWVGEDGRFHARWNVHRITGRWSAEAPACMNWPKADRKKGRPDLRRQVIAPEGRAFVLFDMKQLEARIIALISRDPFLLDVFAKGKDIHSEFARIVWPDFDKRPADERKVLRDMIKRPEYGAFYKGSTETLWKSVVKDFPQVTIHQIGQMVSMMSAKMPGVIAWQDDCLRRALVDREIRSVIYGRRRAFPLGNADPQDATNFGVQSTAADIMATGFMRIMPKLPKGCDPILQIHDAAVFECDEADAERVKDLVVECFTQEHTHKGATVQFPVDVKIGHSWADL